MLQQKFFTPEIISFQGVHPPKSNVDREVIISGAGDTLRAKPCLSERVDALAIIGGFLLEEVRQRPIY